MSRGKVHGWQRLYLDWFLHDGAGILSDGFTGGICHSCKQKFLGHMRKECIGDKNREHDKLDEDHIIIKSTVENEEDNMRSAKHQTDHAGFITIESQFIAACLAIISVEQERKIHGSQRKVDAVNEQKMRVGENSHRGKQHQDAIDTSAQAGTAAVEIFGHMIIHEAEINDTCDRDEQRKCGNIRPIGIGACPKDRPGIDCK